MRGPIYKADVVLLPAAKQPRLVPDWRPTLSLGTGGNLDSSQPPLGIVFADGPRRLDIGTPGVCAFQLLAWPDPTCDRVVPGVEFTLLEGSAVVGTGKVFAMEASGGT